MNKTSSKLDIEKMLLKERMVNIVQRMLGNFGLRIQRIDHDIGMETCLKKLAVRGFYPHSVLDIGAAKGSWTRLAMKYFPNAEYFLIEPLEEWLTNLNELKREKRNVDFLLAAAGSKSGESQIYVSSSNIYESGLITEGDVARNVPLVTVDELFHQGRFRQPQFMKLDVQGYELEVLKGSKKVMEDCELILLELQLIRFTPNMNLLHESIAWMADKGFLPYEIADTVRRPYDDAMGQCDILFIREDNDLLASNRWR